MGWFATPKRFVIPARIRFAFLIVGALAYAITETGRFVLRPIVRAHHLQDLGLTDSIGNLGGIVVQIFLASALMNPTKQQSYRIAVFCSVGFVAYEFAQPLFPKGVFDWNDVYGTVIGLALSLAVLTVLWRLFPADVGEP